MNVISENDDKLAVTSDYEPQFEIFRDLIKFRVMEILLVSSFYDAFVLEEDGRLSDRIFSEYIDLNLRFIPRITRVSSAEEALDTLKKGSCDLVITMARITDMDPLEFGKRVKELKPGMPVVLLTYDRVDVKFLIALREIKYIDKVFYWTGDSKILLAVIKYIEDLKNVDNDIRLGVRVIMVIEDSPRFYSVFLPIIYTEIMTQTRMLISEGVNDLHRLLRMRARPKILLAETYEEGKNLYKKYHENLLGIISDIRFPRKGKIDVDAGFRFAEKVRKEIPDLPFLVQSSNLECRNAALKNGLEFLDKNSDNLLEELHKFIISNFGFGDFIFKNPGGEEIGRAKNLSEFVKMIQIVPDESIRFHAERNHISIWMRARTEFALAEELRPKKVSDFDSIDAIRQFILEKIQKLINRNQYGVISDFGKAQLDLKNSFIRVGNGSLGGKARGIAFLNALLAQTKFSEQFADTEIKTPQTFVICSEVFEEFVRNNNLQEFAILESDNNKIAKKFLVASLSDNLVKDLKTLLQNIRYPIAVRSSSLLEDSQTLPFAGLYSTYMLPNNNPDIVFRLTELANAVKLVYASVFYKSPKEYVRNTNFRIEEEKMAVIIQQVAGQIYNNKLYPVISGVAQSYNFYPISHMMPEDGIVQPALGLGILVAEGDQTYSFSPKYPRMNPPFSSAAEFMKKSQNYFYALNLADKNLQISRDEKYSLLKLDLPAAEEDGTLFYAASTFCGEDDTIKDTISIKGPRVITFANILKYNIFPLAEILEEILKIGRSSFGSHIEIEFAVNLIKERKSEFFLLQIRPLVAGSENVEISLDDIVRDDVICMSEHSLGNGIFDDLYDIVYVDPEFFNASKSRLIAAEVGQINQKLIDENKNYILIGFGRWGTSDPWLGIPVEWHQISKAKIVIESNLGGFNIEPSLGSHFFHNMISLKMGYFHIKNTPGKEFILWDWLKKQEVCNQTKYVKHVRFKKPLKAKINARVSKGVILKPGS
jgi:hypothetical protein